MMKKLPLFSGHTLDSIIAYKDGEAISSHHFLAHAMALSRLLPDQKKMINLCEDRYYFLLSFVAALLREQTTLLPPNRAHDTIENLSKDHQHSYTLSDHPTEYKEFDSFDCTIDISPLQSESIPKIAAEHLCLILYTSGSSGEATPHCKTWGMLVHGAHLTGKQLGIPPGCNLLSTVPPQHMFGLEASIMLTLQYGCSTDNQKALFPADIGNALEHLSSPRALITTPLQLRACAEARQSFPACAFILSATAPLSKKLAQEIEELCNTTVKEIYGSTETGAIATRNTASDNRWTPLPGVTVEKSDEQWQVVAAHLPTPQPLADKLRLEEEGFVLLGRSGDLIKVAGKRVSIGELNHILLSIEGVKDGTFFLPEDKDDGHITRLTAMVVADTLNETVLRALLRQRMDTAFLPRPLIFLDKLPRNETGKLPRQQLVEIFEHHTQRSSSDA